MEERFFIGRVEWVRHDLRVGGVEPLYEETPGSALLAPADAMEFLDEGKVFWGGLPEDVEEGDWWRFRVKDNPSYGKKGKVHDRYEVDHRDCSPAQLAEVIDLRGDKLEAARMKAVREGLELKNPPQEEVYLRLEGDIWLGPVKLEKAGDRWIIPSESRRQMMSCVRPINTEEWLGETSEDQLIICRQALKTVSAGQVDWDSDVEVLKRALRSAPIELEPGKPLTKNQITRLIEGLAVDSLPEPQSLLDKSRRQRVQRIAANLKQNHELAKKLSDIIVALPTTVEILEAEKQKVIQAAQAALTSEQSKLIKDIEALRKSKTALEGETAKAKADAEKELKKAKNKLEGDITKLQAQLQQIKAELAAEDANRQARLEGDFASLDETLTQRLADIKQRPAQLLAEVEILRAVLGIPSAPFKQDLNGANTHQVATAVVGHWPWPERAGDNLSEEKAVEKALRATLKAEGFPVPAKIAPALHSAFLSGALPVVAGSGARRALDAFAHSVAGGRILWIPISPSLLEPEDLLQSTLQGGLASLLESARERDEVCVVALDGLNRAAIESYLMPLLVCFGDCWREGSPGFPVTRGAMPLCWPSNMLLCGTLCDGAATLPPPPSFWESATLLHLDRFSKAEDDSDETSLTVDALPSVSATTLTHWKTWRSNIEKTAFDDFDDFLARCGASDWGFRRGSRLRAARLWAHCRECSPQSALPELLAQCLLPQAVAAGQDEAVAEWLTQNGADFGDGEKWLRQTHIALG